MPKQYTRYKVHVHASPFPSLVCTETFDSINQAKAFMRGPAKKYVYHRNGKPATSMFLVSYDTRQDAMDDMERDEDELADYGLYSDGKWHWTYWNSKAGGGR